MNECSTYMPPSNPDKMLTTTPVSSVEHPIYLHWVIPTSFITVDPEISLCWVSLNERPTQLDWLLKYQYMNEESYLGYFNDEGMPIVTFDDGLSDSYTAILKTKSLAEKDMIQITLPHNLIKRDRRSGTLVAMEIRPQDPLEEVYFVGTHIKYIESPRVIEPIGRKRTRKRRWYDEEPYPYG